MVLHYFPYVIKPIRRSLQIDQHERIENPRWKPESLCVTTVVLYKRALLAVKCHSKDSRLGELLNVLAMHLMHEITHTDRQRVHLLRSHGADFESFEDMRPRTSSMPTKSSYRKPLLHHQHHRYHRSHVALKIAHDDLYTVRTFEMNAKGQIMKKSDSVWSKSSISIVSSDVDVPSNLGSSSSHNSLGLDEVSMHPRTCCVLIVGASDVGKTAIAQQFQTSEYLGGFDTSLGKNQFAMHNVLLNDKM
ncbi:hypothetical protein DPMN_171405 [Dreissena polymorpha]|uniref:Uncharacterized protein n=1 Tax=Dreissena polymorpha TaxID=45954 RepID=A0A9D4DXZ2_DREPO|nr:hypothetical protein DPMN_171405 [Dreissena polymorpha]